MLILNIDYHDILFIIKINKKIKIIHKTNNNYICNDCNKTFSTKQRYKYHATKKVCANKQYDCRYCGAKFTTNISMYRHMRESCKSKSKSKKEVVIDLTKFMINY